jgi:hypothetical protein
MSNRLLFTVFCWNLGFGIWDLEFGIWNLGFRIWNLVLGIWNLEFDVWWNLNQDFYTYFQIFFFN